MRRFWPRRKGCPGTSDVVEWSSLLFPLRRSAPLGGDERIRLCVPPATKGTLEAVLREGESLTQFIESAVCLEAAFRAEQNAVIAWAKQA